MCYNCNKQRHLSQNYTKPHHPQGQPSFDPMIGHTSFPLPHFFNHEIPLTSSTIITVISETA